MYFQIKRLITRLNFRISVSTNAMLKVRDVITVILNFVPEKSVYKIVDVLVKVHFYLVIRYQAVSSHVCLIPLD